MTPEETFDREGVICPYCGYKDKSESDEKLMRQKEEEKITMFHVKH